MKTPKSSELRIWRIAAILLGVLWLLWLPFEDSDERWVILFAVAICGLFEVRILMSGFVRKYSLARVASSQRHPGVIRSYLFYALIGAIAGIGITVVALLLMAFKTGLHGHATPDYTVEQMIAVAQLTPIWILAGMLTSIGFAVWQSRYT
ncbi:MAG: hypothetical protein PVF74_02325 [Anaerolineales bacterium]